MCARRKLADFHGFHFKAKTCHKFYILLHKHKANIFSNVAYFTSYKNSFGTIFSVLV